MLCFIFALAARINSVLACIDGFFCSFILEKFSCYTTDIEERAAVLEMCPMTCDACNGTQTPTSSPTVEEEEVHDEMQDTIILSALGFLMFVLVICGFNITFCTKKETSIDEEETSRFSSYEEFTSESVIVQDVDNDNGKPAGNMGCDTNNNEKNILREIKSEPVRKKVRFADEVELNGSTLSRCLTVD
jgi:hypothetical protein